MIRQANKYDKDHVIQLIKESYLYIGFENKIDTNNYEHQSKLFDAVIAGRGVIFLEENKGLLASIITPTFFDPSTLILNCVVWIVRPEFRNTKLGYALVQEYINYAEKLKQEGRIKHYTIGKTPYTPDIDYGKLGFKKMDETWSR